MKKYKMTSLLESALKKRPFLNRTEGPFDRGRIGVIVRFPLKARRAERINSPTPWPPENVRREDPLGTAKRPTNKILRWNPLSPFRIKIDLLINFNRKD